ncbi:23S rRNA (adenine(2030)-N(6))-methyltransferase RlmJ [Flocculibacter collagenilyticus]|uniref:23S rRNA (adenine(2030)-N(6))-methyltransferase RlmJ n=1 Tax=Flocculibacter collagenilyticus TaxID=2744479 RepID=UPI0018F39D81|nr:23S rRNA (adenine(2030)-N(6))-methyltransferase RlmJ [Flocculibacter collagenilyticus]
MLSYRHAFHAGNFADVLKHCVQIQVLNYLAKKDKAYTYIDTHSGAGIYQLSDNMAQKTAEYRDGIERLWHESNLPEPLQNYLSVIKTINDNHNSRKALKVYPGSPAIAQHLARQQDTLQLFELHPTDNKLLTQLMGRRRKVHVNQSDGYASLKALLPTPSRRAMVLIDPPYELKSDYADAVAAIIQGYQRLNSATYLLWYPVVQRHYIKQMEQDFVKSEVRNVLKIEWCLAEDSAEFGMTGTGLFVVNPPWTLMKEMEQVLPALTKHLGNEQSSYSLTQIVAE